MEIGSTYSMLEGRLDVILELLKPSEQTGRYFPRDRMTIGHRKSQERKFFSQEIFSNE